MSAVLNRVAVLSIVATALSCTVPVAGQTCEAPELVEPSPPEYVALICSSIEQADKGAFAEAARRLEAALEVQLHEYPNYRALPRLALYYLQSGDTGAAERVLEEARLALSTVFGLLTCASQARGFDLQARERPVESPAAPAVIQRMCGEAYDSFYAQTDLQSIRQDLPLLEVYYRARDLVSRE